MEMLDRTGFVRAILIPHFPTGLVNARRADPSFLDDGIEEGFNCRDLRYFILCPVVSIDGIFLNHLSKPIRPFGPAALRKSGRAVAIQAIDVEVVREGVDWLIG